MFMGGSSGGSHRNSNVRTVDTVFWFGNKLLSAFFLHGAHAGRQISGLRDAARMGV